MTNANASRVVRILYKEIVPGDLRKIDAESNDSDTGGGARDFRFGSWNQIQAVVRPMFPDTVYETRRRQGQSQDTAIYQGVFCWHDAQGNMVQKESFFEPPTDARPSEGRIARVHEYDCFETSRVVGGEEGNKAVLLLIQREDGSVWPHYTDERSLRTPRAWDSSVATHILTCLAKPRVQNRTAIGCYDVSSAGTSYCNA